MQDDTDLAKKALMQKLVAGPGSDLGGLGEPGGFAGPATEAPIGPKPDAPMPASPIAAAAPASNFGRTMGLDQGKFDDPNKHDFKYDTTRVLSRFDPRQGFTPDVINALNTELGGTYGTYGGSGDKLSLTGAKGAKDAGDFGPQDWIGAFKANNGDTKWNFGGGAVANQAAAAAPQGGPGGGPAGMSLASIDPLLSGDPMAKIQAALAQLSGPRDNAQELLRQLVGGRG